MKTTAEFWRELQERNARRERIARIAVASIAIFLLIALFYGVTR